MREFIYPFEQTKASLKDPYGRTRASFTLLQGANTLPPLEKKGYYCLTNTNTRFYIYDGDGTLAWEDCQIPYDLSPLLKEANLDKLDRLLQNPLNTKHTKATREFLEIYEKNITKQTGYLLPPYFEVIDELLSTGGIVGAKTATQPIN